MPNKILEKQGVKAAIDLEAVNLLDMTDEIDSDYLRTRCDRVRDSLVEISKALAEQEEKSSLQGMALNLASAMLFYSGISLGDTPTRTMTERVLFVIMNKLGYIREGKYRNDLMNIDDKYNLFYKEWKDNFSTIIGELANTQPISKECYPGLVKVCRWLDDRNGKECIMCSNPTDGVVQLQGETVPICSNCYVSNSPSVMKTAWEEYKKRTKGKV